MRKARVVIAGILVLSLAVFALLGGCRQTEAAKLKVVTTTSLLAQIVERVGGDLVSVVNIIPPAQCPGHFDVKPSDIQKLADADLFLMHNWQGEKFTDELIASANNPDLTVAKVDIKGNWMTPPVQMQAVDEIANCLAELDEDNRDAYQQQAARLKDMIEAKAAEIKAKLAGKNLSSVKVICAEKQVGFVKWVGLDIVATFGRPDSLTPAVIKELVDKGRAEKVGLIIENLQSGKDAGKALAEELGCPRIILSNFPGGLANTETWEKAIDENIRRILEAVAR